MCIHIPSSGQKLKYENTVPQFASATGRLP